MGKIGVPDHILLKPGRLTPEEFSIMRSHVELAEKILGDNDAPMMQMGLRIALTHHEKWDGTGYPNGLKGEDIPLEGRIAAINDVYDALTSQRPYKQAWSSERAVVFIRSESGRHFDPELVQAFLRILPNLLRVRETHPDEDGPAEPEGEEVAVVGEVATTVVT